MMPHAIYDICKQVLLEADIEKKAHYLLSIPIHDIKKLPLGTAFTPPMRPKRPAKPTLVAPIQVPKRSLKTEKGIITLFHALAHIECNAIDLAVDMVARFAAQSCNELHFAQDFLKVAHEEAKHFMALQNMLQEYGYHYGAFCAHDGLWQAAIDSADNFLARLVVVPLILEARGLDVTPAMIEACARLNKQKELDILTMIHQDEITHVQTGYKWLVAECAGNPSQAKNIFKTYANSHFKGRLKPPFNHRSRKLAGMDESWYQHV